MAAPALQLITSERNFPAEVPDAVAAAHAAGLRHVDDHGTGLRRHATGRRLRQGKHWVAEFEIVDHDGRRVRDPATLERVRKLAIPPAWTDVWICTLPEGHVQATGRDARRRKQYRYHPRWRTQRDGTKYSRMIALGHALPALRRRVAADLRRPGLPRAKVLATVVRLLETTFIRVGNEEYARSNRSYGLTTLKDRHVRFAPGGLRFRFRGKSGVFHEISVHDAKLARIVRRCRELPGQELFQYQEDDGRRATIDSADVNAYIREAVGDDFTAKDFRTWAGTVLAGVALCELAAERGGGRPTRRDVTRAVSRVAERLGNTVSVCRKSYVHPAVITSYVEGTLPAVVETHPPQPGTGLRPEETAVLRLLERRQRDDQTGASLRRQLRGSLKVLSRPRSRS